MSSVNLNACFIVRAAGDAGRYAAILKTKDEAMKPTLGQKYSRQEISEMIGGSPQIYLPSKDGEILCGCFRPSPEYNPDAPGEVLFGPSPSGIVEENAEIVYRQAAPIPIFIFRSNAQWEYIGNYRCVRHSRDANLIEERMKKYPERGEIAGILWFEKT